MKNKLPSIVRYNLYAIFLLLLVTACTTRNPQSELPGINSHQEGWKVLGPGGSGGVFIPTISPFDSNFIFAKGDMTGDGGKNWVQVFDERVRVFAAAFDPRNSHTIFINTFQNAAYRSDDDGKTWNRIKGYRFKWGHRPVPDPRNPDMLFLTTYGGSVFYGPALGVQNEFGRIENIPVSWW